MNHQHHPYLGNQISSSGVSIARPVTPNDSSNEDGDSEKCKFNGSEDTFTPRGLTGLRNMGLTCYMNAGLQALSNSVPLCQFMRECSPFIRTEKKQIGVAWPFQKLVEEMWTQHNFSNVVPSVLYHSFRTMYPMFRPFSQQDSQEFLRYFMDQLHEELREPYFPMSEDTSVNEEGEKIEGDSRDTSCASGDSDCLSRSDADDYETCDSGLSDRSLSTSLRSRSNRSNMQRKAKRKKRHHYACRREDAKVEHDTSEFSDTGSENSLLGAKKGSYTDDTKSSFSKPHYSVTSSSGIGSSKPSVSSVYSYYNHKSSDCRAPSKSTLTNSNSCSRTIYATNKVIFNDERKRKHTRYRSIVSDCFDGILLSSVQCLTCNRTSSKKETFQDLSLPIPSTDQLSMLQHQHSSLHLNPKVHSSVSLSSQHDIYLSKKSCDVTGDGWMWFWIWSVWGWVRSWLWGPSVSLLNCLAAFFSADELKGDNMYSCDKCGKLRNGIKYSKVLRLPEILIIHLKRFRHDYMYSSKISQYVSFPMHDLDLTPFLHKDCSSDVRTYDLYAVICHHGAVGSGHYTSYAQNATDGCWYEFDDQSVTEVSSETVLNCEAYVLFYKKCSFDILSRRQRTIELMQVSSRELSLMQFYISKQWINKFNTFSEPGPIDNSDFLCPHGGVQPLKAAYVNDLVLAFSQGVWEYLHQVFGGGPACTSLYECVTCREQQDALSQRQKYEHETFIRLLLKFQEVEYPDVVYAISLKWYRCWEAFALRRQSSPPGPLDNTSICMNRNGIITLKPGSDYAPISKEMWTFFHSIYGGGPDLFVRYGSHLSSSLEDRQPSSSESNEVSEIERLANVNNTPSPDFSLRLKSLSAGDIPFCVLNSHPNVDTLKRSLSANAIFSSALTEVSEEANKSSKNFSNNEKSTKEKLPQNESRKSKKRVASPELQNRRCTRSHKKSVSF